MRAMPRSKSGGGEKRKRRQSKPWRLLYGVAVKKKISKNTLKPYHANHPPYHAQCRRRLTRLGIHGRLGEGDHFS